jgi:hypothetical protein
MLKSAFEVPVFLVGDFNETLHPSERSSGYLNVTGSKAFKSFLSNRDFIEYPLVGHRYTWFWGRSMSRIDRTFASPSCLLEYPLLSLTRYP